MTLGWLVMAFFLSSSDMTVLLAPDEACSACRSHPSVSQPVLDALTCSWLLPSQPGVPRQGATASPAAAKPVRDAWAGNEQTWLQ